jgi:hypothetical protein
MGGLHLYHAWPGLSVVEASCDMACEVPLYRRTVALIGPYVVDIFRVAGAGTRDYLFHSIGDGTGDDLEMETGPGTWERQEKGTLAGPDVALASKGGYGFLFDVRRLRTDGGFKAVWRAKEDRKLGLRLLAVGGPGRTLIRAKGEGFGVRGQSPFEAHVIQREECADHAASSRFVNVFEVFKEKPALGEVRELGLAPATEPVRGLSAVALAIREGERTQYVFSAMDGHTLRRTEADGLRFEFAGRFGVVTTRGGRVEAMRLVGGRRLACGEAVLETAGDFIGIVERVDLEGNALLVRPDAGSAPLPHEIAGQSLIASNPVWAVNSSYEIAGAEATPEGLVRVRLAEMPLLVARGVVESADLEEGCFASRTPVMKLRYVPRIFDGKRVRSRDASGAPEFVLKSAAEKAIALANRDAIRHFPPGGEYFIYDVGAGDRVEIAAVGQQ